MSRWHLKPKRFVGSLELDGRSAPVRFAVGVSVKGSAKITIDRMPLDMSTKFIVDALDEQPTTLRFCDFTLLGEARDGSTFRADRANFHSPGFAFSDSASSTLRLAPWCGECHLVLPAPAAAKPGIKALLRGFESIHRLSATCKLGEVEMCGAMPGKRSETDRLSGALSINGPAAGIEFAPWREEVDALFKHVRSIMSFARGARLCNPVIERIADGKFEMEVRAVTQQEARGEGPFNAFDCGPIFRQAVAAHFFEPARRKDIGIAIEWFTMPAGFREAKLTSAMTVLENLLTANLDPSDLAARPDKEFRDVRRAMLVAAREVLKNFALDNESEDRKSSIDQEIDLMRAKLADLNRRSLLEKVQILSKRWGAPMDGISDEALGRAKRARDHIVHRGQYVQEGSSDDLMDHVRLARELVVRFVFAALEYQGPYTSPMSGEREKFFKRLAPQPD